MNSILVLEIQSACGEERYKYLNSKITKKIKKQKQKQKGVQLTRSISLSNKNIVIKRENSLKLIQNFRYQH